MAVLAASLAVALAATAVLAARLHAKRIESAQREAEAATRAREMALVAAVAKRLLSEGGPAAQLGWIGPRVAEALGASSARVELVAVPSPLDGERVARLPLERRSGWIYAIGGEDPAAVAEPLARLIDVALERERVGAQEASAEAARRGDLAKTAVLHLVSNDLRPVMHAIQDAVDGLAPDGDRSERLRLAVDRATSLVDDLVDLSRMESGTLRSDPEDVDLHELITAAAAGHPDVQVALPADLPAVQADRAQVERVFANLIDNAVRYSPPGAPVRITGGAAGGRATVRVIDRGPGIPAAQRARVFEPLVSGSPSPVASSRPTAGGSSCSPAGTARPRSRSPCRWPARAQAPPTSSLPRPWTP
jgi:two-component system sensor histidine kinase KdpD